MKFVRLGDYVLNVSEIITIQKIGAGCKVIFKDSQYINISSVDEEQFENAMAYICCGCKGGE